MPDDLRRAIADAFALLGPPSNKENELEVAIDTLVIHGTTPRLPNEVAKQRVQAFRKVGREASLGELERIAAAHEELAAAYESLHGPAIDALAHCGIITGRHEPNLQHHRALACQARAAKSRIGNDRPDGKQKNLEATGIAQIIAFNYERIWDRRADLPFDAGGCRGLEGLIKTLFQILKIEGSPKAALRAAIKERTEREDASVASQKIA